MTPANDSLNAMDQRVVALLRKHGPLGVAEIAIHLGEPEFVTAAHLRTLREEGVISRALDGVRYEPASGGYSPDPVGGAA